MILDDRPARRAAETLGIPCIGILSVIARAKQLGHIPAARPVIEKMINLGFRAAPGRPGGHAVDIDPGDVDQASG